MSVCSFICRKRPFPPTSGPSAAPTSAPGSRRCIQSSATARSSSIPGLGAWSSASKTATEATALENSLLVTFTYGAVGAVGAQPIDLSLPDRMDCRGRPAQKRSAAPGSAGLAARARQLEHRQLAGAGRNRGQPDARARPERGRRRDHRERNRHAQSSSIPWPSLPSTVTARSFA